MMQISIQVSSGKNVDSIQGGTCLYCIRALAFSPHFYRLLPFSKSCRYYNYFTGP
jgi:hypothetical protein